MSSKIYFTGHNGKTFIWWITRAITNLILIMPRRFSLSLSKKLLLTPVRRRSKSLPTNMTVEDLDIGEGNIAVYRLGNGPVVILSHGWSGSASQLFPLMKKIADAGFQAVAFDQIAHGQSSGKEANLFLFIKSKKAVIELVEKQHSIKAVIAHSMGSPALLRALRQDTNDKTYPLLLIAPVLKLLDSMFDRVEKSGVSTKMLTNVLQSLEEQHKMKIFGTNSINDIAEYQGKVYIVHDEDDQFTSLKDSQKVAELYPHVKLTATKKLGHGRVISSDETWQTFTQMVANG